jgi:hypothetical protein
MQNTRIVGNGIDSLRGMALTSVQMHLNTSQVIQSTFTVDGATLKRVNGILQIVGITDASITKVASGKTLRTQAVNTGRILAILISTKAL